MHTSIYETHTKTTLSIGGLQRTKTVSNLTSQWVESPLYGNNQAAYQQSLGTGLHEYYLDFVVYPGLTNVPITIWGP